MLGGGLARKFRDIDESRTSVYWEVRGLFRIFRRPKFERHHVSKQ